MNGAEQQIQQQQQGMPGGGGGGGGMPVDAIKQEQHQQQQQHGVNAGDISAIMQAQGVPAAAQAQIMAAIAAAQQQGRPVGGVVPLAGSTVDMASVLAKIQALEREKTDLRAKLESTNSALTKYREEKSVGMKDRYAKEIKEFIEGLQLKDPEVKKAMHDRMEALANQGNETGVWEILACASSNHRANVNQIEALTTEVNSYRENLKQLQGGIFQSEGSRIDQGAVGVGGKRSEPDSGFTSAGNGASSSSPPWTGNGNGGGGDGGNDPGNIWGDFHDMIMKQGGNRGIDLSASHGGMERRMMGI